MMIVACLRRLFARLRPALVLRAEWIVGNAERRAARRVERERSRKAHWRRRQAELRAARERFDGSRA